MLAAWVYLTFLVWLSLLKILLRISKRSCSFFRHFSTISSYNLSSLFKSSIFLVVSHMSNTRLASSGYFVSELSVPAAFGEFFDCINSIILRACFSSNHCSNVFTLGLSFRFSSSIAFLCNSKIAKFSFKVASFSLSLFLSRSHSRKVFPV